MKYTLRAAVAALSIGSIPPAIASEGGSNSNTQFTSILGVIAQAPVQNPTSAVAQNGQVHVYATQSEQAASPFQPGSNNG